MNTNGMTEQSTTVLVWEIVLHLGKVLFNKDKTKTVTKVAVSFTVSLAGIVCPSSPAEGTKSHLRGSQRRGRLKVAYWLLLLELDSHQLA